MSDLTARGKAALTLGVLAVLFLGGITWAWSEVTEPFPEPLKVAKCTDQPVQVGERIRPQQVLVSVLNASGRSGLAGSTMDGLMGFGFGEGDKGNAPEASATAPAVVWAKRDDPAAQLVASYLGNNVEIVEQSSFYPGITVVVGDDFPGVTKGRRGVTAAKEGWVCTPTTDPDQAE